VYLRDSDHSVHDWLVVAGAAVVDATVIEVVTEDLLVLVLEAVADASEV
jgi:hypothetical protein